MLRAPLQAMAMRQEELLGLIRQAKRQATAEQPASKASVAYAQGGSLAAGTTEGDVRATEPCGDAPPGAPSFRPVTPTLQRNGSTGWASPSLDAASTSGEPPAMDAAGPSRAAGDPSDVGTAGGSDGAGAGRGSSCIVESTLEDTERRGSSSMAAHAVPGRSSNGNG
jgi:hypothetical protein